MNLEQKQSVDSTMKPEPNHAKPTKEKDEWLKTMVLETTDGVFCTASLMMGVCALTQAHVKAIILLCALVGVVVGACTKALAEFVSVSRRNNLKNDNHNNINNDEEVEKRVVVVVVQQPLQSALASGMAFATGAMMPLMAAVFMRGYVVRLGVVAGVMSLCFAVFGWVGAFLGGASRLRAGIRVLVFGWVAMAIALGLIVLQW